MKTTVGLIGCLFVMLLSGCSTTWQYVKFPDQSKRTDDPARCRVYVIRPAEDAGRMEANVFDDKQLVGSTRPGGYLCWERTPGPATLLSSSSRDHRLPLTLDAGQVYYIVQRVGSGGLRAGTTLEAVPEERGRAAMQGCKAPTLRTHAGTRDAYGGQLRPAELTPP